jgi:hypothetical protein
MTADLLGAIALSGGGSLRCAGGGGEVLGGFGDGGEHFDEFVHLGEFEAVLDHGLRGGDVQAAADGFEFAEAADQGADGGAVGVGDGGEVEDDAGVAGGDESVDFFFEAGAFGAAVDAAVEGQGGDARL